MGILEVFPNLAVELAVVGEAGGAGVEVEPVGVAVFVVGGVFAAEGGVHPGGTAVGDGV